MTGAFSCLCQPFAFFVVAADVIFVVLKVYKDAISESTSWGAYEALSTSLEMPSGTVVYLLTDIVFTPLHIISVAAHRPRAGARKSESS